MIPDICVWEHLTDFSHEVSNNDTYHTTLEAIKTSCSSNTVWLPTIQSDIDVNIIDPILDFKFCPFCGGNISNIIIIDV